MRDTVTPDCGDPGDAGEAVCRVLVVDDQRNVAEAVARALRKQGHEVRTALDGPSALEEAAAFRPHIVFADIGLPRMNGLALAARIREEPTLRNTVLVAMTGYEDDDTLERIRQATFDHCLIKPPDLAAMEKLIRSAVSHRAEG